MKSKILIGLIFALLVTGEIIAQVSLDTLFRIVLENNQNLKAATHRYEAEQIASRVGNSPPNPEVEYGYMWGSPEQLGNRVDFAITQTFDFPTAYTSQAKLSKINNRTAELKMIATRQEILLQAHKAWIEGVFLNINQKMLVGRLKQAEQVYEGFKRKLETGETSQLLLNQAHVKTTLLNNELQRAELAIQNNYNLLNQLSGGKEIIIPDTILPEPTTIVVDTIIDDYQSGPMSMLYDNEISKREQEADVIFNRKLPKLKAGYYSEEILNATLRGVKAGITIPLWGNARAVNSAKAGQVFAESDAWRFQSEQNATLNRQYQQWASLKKQVEELRTVINTADNEYLLLQSVDAGEISLTQYFYESDFFFQSRLALLETWKELLLVEADLLKIYR